MKWVRWQAIGIPFDAAQAVYQATSGSMSSKMVGNGEHLFAAHIGGSVSSDDAFDVLGPDGKRYEVKTLGNFRFNHSGTIAEKVHNRFLTITSELECALSDIYSIRFSFVKKRADEIAHGSYMGKEKILGRDFKNGKRILGLKQMSDLLRNELMVRGSDDVVEFICGCYRKMKAYEYVRVLEVIGIHTHRFDEIDMVYADLNDECFHKRDVIDDLWKLLKPSEILLTHCDSFVVVSEDFGYIIIERDEIDNFVEFCGFANGEAHFKTKKELKELPCEIMESSTAGVQLEFAERFRDLRKKEQEDSVWDNYCALI